MAASSSGSAMPAAFFGHGNPMNALEDNAATVALLASDDASFVTGSYYTVDGGYTAQ